MTTTAARRHQVRLALSAVSVGVAALSDDASSDDLVERTLAWLDLTQAQIAALLAVSPQAISKGFREKGIDYLDEDNKAKSLYLTLTQIGGDRYSTAASSLKKLAIALDWKNIESSTEEITSPQDLYAYVDELWVLADNPSAILNWESLRAQIMTSLRRTAERVVVFFTRTLEGAERWAEVLEREFARDAIQDGFLEPEKTAVANSYIYIIVTNALSFSQDHVIANPGSRCMGLGTTTRAPSVYFWNGNDYCRIATPNLDFIRLAQGLGLGTTSQKVNFFPRGMQLKSEVLEFKHAFIDALFAVRGPTTDEDETDSGEGLAGGVFRTVMGRSSQTHVFNKRTKFTPVFILTYKRRPGDGMNKNPNRTIRILQDELARNSEARVDLDTRLQQSPDFW
ncbi:MAG: hypothetical protein JSS17_01670 [Proteobacteria bacterium]|nr:hypothetical protein [Pseudomonadota bacterium]